MSSELPSARVGVPNRVHWRRVSSFGAVSELRYQILAPVPAAEGVTSAAKADILCTNFIQTRKSFIP